MTLRAGLSCLALTAAVFTGNGFAANGFATKAQLETLSGTYVSPVPERWYGGFGTREFSFENGRWTLSFVHALDADMQVRTFRFRTGGPYAIDAASAIVPGAYEGRFTESQKFVTLLSDDVGIVQAFGFTECGLIVGVEVDISETGCGSWKPVADCGIDHDLFAKDEAGVHFGQRPPDNDLCTPDKRPIALLPPVVERRP